jgi:hypothetical protein
VSGKNGMGPVDASALTGSPEDEPNDETLDAEASDNETDDGCSTEGDDDGGTASDAEDGTTSDHEDEPTQGDDSDHCPLCGWCDAMEMVVCAVESCSQWYHVHCLELPKAHADQISDTDFLWLCPSCDPSEVEE